MLHWVSSSAGIVGTIMHKARTRETRIEEEKEDIGCTKRQKWPKPKSYGEVGRKRRKEELESLKPQVEPRVQGQRPYTQRGWFGSSNLTEV
jgi:hypothetical protein